MNPFSVYKREMARAFAYTKHCYHHDKKTFRQIVAFYFLFLGLLLFWIALEIHNGLQNGWALMP